MATREMALIGGAATHYRVTIPLPAVDNDGHAFAEPEIEWFEAMLLRVASGWRKHHFVGGAWDSGNEIFREPVAVYVSTIEEHRVPELQDFLEEACSRFRQDAILLELAPVEKIFLTKRKRIEAAVTVTAAEASL